MGAPSCRALWEKGAQVNTTRIPDPRGLGFRERDNRITLQSYFELLNETSKLLVLQIFKSFLTFSLTHLNQK